MRRSTLVLLVIGLFTGACSSDAVVPDPVTLIDEAAHRLEVARGFRFRISRVGEPVEVGGWLVREVSGVFEAPDAVDSRVKITLAGITVEAGIVSIGPQTWQQDPLSAEWILLDPASSVSVAGIFGRDGLVSVLREDLDMPLYMETTELESLPGETLHHIRADIDTARLERISVGLMPATADVVDLYFTDEGELRRVEILDPDGNWIIDAWAYGDDYRVEPPA